jgi:hypothetical protein
LHCFGVAEPFERFCTFCCFASIELRGASTAVLSNSLFYCQSSFPSTADCHEAGHGDLLPFSLFPMKKRHFPVGAAVL